MSLYEAVVPTYIQYIGSLKRIVLIAESARAAGDSNMEGILSSRLAPDMNPLAFQIDSVVVHSLGALRTLLSGNFGPEYTAQFDGLSDAAAYLTEGRAAIEALDRKAIDAAAASTIVTDKHGLDFSIRGAEFLTSFEQPNFFFHVTTAYAIFRSRGLAIGKYDYLGRLRTLPKHES